MGKRIYFLFLLFVVQITAVAQESDFKPCATFSDKSTEKLSAIRERTQLEIDRINSPKKNLIKEKLNDRLDFLINEFANRKFVDNATLQQVVNEIWTRLLESNSLKNRPGEVLISTSPDANAFSFGEGTIILNVGLLGRVENESQLAFALAHELAHYELGHTLSTLIKQIESSDRKKISSAMMRLRNGKFDERDYFIAKNWIYATSSFRRQDEMAADSLGFIFFKNCGYRQDQAIGLLNVLDSANAAKYNGGGKFFEVINFTEFPFKASWIKDHTQANQTDSLREFFLDSIRSHPHTGARIKKLSMVVKNEGAYFLMNETQFQNASLLAAFESVQGALDNQRVDKCLFLALQLRLDYPKSDYLATMIGRSLLSVNIQRMHPKARPIFAISPQYYKYDLRSVVNFLNNTGFDELSELTFRFINSKKNFNPANEEHYFILWKISDLTNRKKTLEKVRETYQAKFPNGEFVNDMIQAKVPKGYRN